MRVASKVKKKKYVIDHLFWTSINKAVFILNGVKYGRYLKVRGKCYVYNLCGKITIGNRVRMNSAPWANPIGAGDRIWIRTIENGEIRIGDGTGISNTAIISACLVDIGTNCLIGAGCKIYDTDFHTLYPSQDKEEDVRTRPIIIGDNVFVGAGSTILKGTEIGSNSIIGAGSVVAGKIPESQVWAGNPAKCVRRL